MNACWIEWGPTPARTSARFGPVPYELASRLVHNAAHACPLDEWRIIDDKGRVLQRISAGAEMPCCKEEPCDDKGT
jgi:hypothetical protein